jgi:hypothetical protein
MAHGDAIAYSRYTEHERNASRFGDTTLYLFHQLIEVNMAGYDIIPGVSNTYEWFGHILGRHSRSSKQAPAGRLVQPFLDLIAPHFIPAKMRVLLENFSEMGLPATILHLDNDS